MLEDKHRYLVCYRENPRGGILKGSVEITSLFGPDVLGQIGEAVKNKYGPEAELVASMSEKVEHA